MSKKLKIKDIVNCEFELFKRPSELKALPLPSLYETFDGGFRRGMEYNTSRKVKMLEKRLIEKEKKILILLEEIYLSEFETIDGVKRHKDGYTFNQWCIKRHNREKTS